MILSSSQRESLRDQVLQLLWDAGLKVESEPLAAALSAAGCQTTPCGRVRIPRQLIDEMAAAQCRTRAQDALDQELHFFCGIDWAHHIIWNKRQDQIRERLKSRLLMSAFDCGPTTFYDYTQGRVLPVDTALFVEMMKFAQATPEIGYISTWYRQDVPQQMERIASLILGLEYTDKVDGIEAIDPPVIKYLREVSEIVTDRPGDASYLAGSECMTSPLILGRRSADDILERKRCGIHRYHVASMPTIGISTPVTPGSSVVMTAAEILGGMAACWAIDPESDLSGRAIALVADMRNGNSTPSGAEPVLVGLAVRELFEAWWGGHLWTEVFFSPYAKRPGLQAVYENFCGLWRYSRLLGNPAIPYPGMGTLNSGGTGSPTQFMLDLEIRKSQFALKDAIADDGSEMPPAEVAEAVRGDKEFLGSDHTAQHCRRLWASRLFRTDNPFVGAWHGDEKAVLDSCDALWRENLKRYQPPAWPQEKRNALQGVLSRAEKELSGG